MGDENNIIRYLKEISLSKNFSKENEMIFFKKLHKHSQNIWKFIFKVIYRNRKAYQFTYDIFKKKRSLRKHLHLIECLDKNNIRIDNLKTLYKEYESYENRDPYEDFGNLLSNIDDIELNISKLSKKDIDSDLTINSINLMIQNFLISYVLKNFEGVLIYNFFLDFQTYYIDNISKNHKWPAKVNKEFHNIFQKNLVEVDKMRNRFATANLKLVVTVSKHYLKSNLPWPDIIQEGNLGLLKAIERYDYRTGNRFSTYAIWWIKQSIVRAIIEKGNTIRIPLHLIDSYNRIKRVMLEHLNENNVLPDISQISQKTNLDKDKVVKVLEYLTLEFVSLNSPINKKSDDNQILYEDIVKDESNVTPLERLEKEFIVAFIKENLDKLSDMQKKVLVLRYGFENESYMTLEQIGNRYNLSRERIRQIQEKALIKLRGLIRKSSKILTDN